MKIETPTILVIVGITGDLAGRKLLPAIEAIATSGTLPNDFVILGISRKDSVTVSDVTRSLTESSYVRTHLEILQMDVNNFDEYETLKNKLTQLEATFGKKTQRLFYLSVPPQATEAVLEMFGKSGLSGIENTKILLEKPFGVDFQSATKLVEVINAHFTPSQVYRIDHYVAKEMAQNLIVFRERNALFRRTWNSMFIERIEIVAQETIGIEGRGDFYEQTGALRDLVQSHLLQLAALTLMDPGQGSQKRSVSERRLDALKHLHITTEKPFTESVQRGQYQGYRNEVHKSTSMVETAVQIELESDSPAFSKVPILLSTGKMLGKKVTHVHIFYKKDNSMESNDLILRLQPNEGICMSIWSKCPGYENKLQEKTLNFDYAEEGSVVADAYEKVLVDTMRGDHDLFISNEEVLESWSIIAPIQDAWKKSPENLLLYEPGTMPFGTEPSESK